MQQLPTTWQYLLDVVVAARQEAAKTIINPIARNGQIKKYADLKESECEFSVPVENATSANSWVIDISVPGRGFKLEGIAYKTGTVLGMAKPNANVMLVAESLDTATTTGLYLVEETQQLHLLVHPQSNLWEGLQMTGYKINANQFNAEEYDQRNSDLKADGHIDIKDSVVAGRVYVSYIQQAFKAPIADEPIAPVVEEKVTTEIIPPVIETTPVIDQTLTDSPPETKPELTEEEQIQALLDAEKKDEAVDSEEPQQQPKPNFQKNKNK